MLEKHLKSKDAALIGLRNISWQNKLDWCRSRRLKDCLRVLHDGMCFNCKMAMSLVMETSKDWWQYRTGHFFFPVNGNAMPETTKAAWNLLPKCGKPGKFTLHTGSKAEASLERGNCVDRRVCEMSSRVQLTGALQFVKSNPVHADNTINLNLSSVA
jgi:hypothetical protein